MTTILNEVKRITFVYHKEVSIFTVAAL